MLLGKPDQVMDLQRAAVIQDDAAGIQPKHLVDFAEDDTQVRSCGAVLEGGESQLEPSLVIGEIPGFHIIAGFVIEADRAQLVDPAIYDDGVLGGLA